MSGLPSNATLEERERYAYTDELKEGSDHMRNKIIQLEEYITKLQERHLD